MFSDPDCVRRLVAGRFTGARVLVLGDLMLDCHIRGEVTRISPEAPVPVVRVVSRSWSPGGAANVAANLNELGLKVELVGALVASYAKWRKSLLPCAVRPYRFSGRSTTQPGPAAEWQTKTKLVSERWRLSPPAMNCITAHLLVLGLRAAAGITPGAAQGGFQTGSNIDGISVQKLPPPVKNAFGWWLAQTPYGQMVSALLAVAGVGGVRPGLVAVKALGMVMLKP